MTTWSLQWIWRSQCATEVNITTNKNDIIMDVVFGFLNFHKRDYCRLDNSLKLILDFVSNTEQLWRSF